jgi:methionine-rich copper-binding protein CopC
MHAPFDDGSRAALVLSALRRAILILLLPSVDPRPGLGAPAILLESVPPAGATVSAPARLVLRFNSRVEARLSSVMLVGGPRQTRVLLSSPPQAPDSDTLTYSLPELSPGGYRAEWRARSVDGQFAEGVLRFTVIQRAQ